MAKVIIKLILQIFFNIFFAKKNPDQINDQGCTKMNFVFYTIKRDLQKYYLFFNFLIFIINVVNDAIIAMQINIKSNIGLIANKLMLPNIMDSIKKKLFE